MGHKLGQIIARGQSTWLVRIYQGCDPETGTRKYHNQTIHGSFREAQRFLNLKLQQRDLTRAPRSAAVTLNQFLDQWLANEAIWASRRRPKRSSVSTRSRMRAICRLAKCCGSRSMLWSVRGRGWNRDDKICYQEQSASSIGFVHREQLGFRLRLSGSADPASAASKGCLVTNPG